MKKISSDRQILILGVGGLLGGTLFSKLKDLGTSVFGTVRSGEDESKGLYKLDTTKEEEVKNFDWEKFDVVIDCTGLIQYQKTPTAIAEALEINTLAPLRILGKLSPNQHYVYCSTHAVLIPSAEYTAYTLSKKFFEDAVAIFSESNVRVSVMRIPALFGEARKAGLLNTIKGHFLKKNPLEMSLNFSVWHPMYVERAAELLAELVSQKGEEKIITLGYPCEATIEQILTVAEKAFGYSVPVHLSENKSDHYMPDLVIQNKYIHITADDFASDLTVYFKK